MPTKKNPRAKPAPEPASEKASPTKARAAKASRPAPGPAREATPIASGSLLTLTTANFAALRTQLTAGGGKRAHAAAAKDDKNLADTLKRLEAGYRELLRRV